MFEPLRCRLKGHVFVDSRSQPGMQTCVRCRHRQPFETNHTPTSAEPTPPAGTREDD